MKIGIVGNYGNNNNGDEAILSGILQQLLHNFPIQIEDITVFSNNPQQTVNRYGVKSYPLYYKKGRNINTFIHTYKKNRNYIKSLDLLVIGGGGILMDFYKREAQLFGTYALMAKNMSVPYVVYGCGAGPIHTSMGKWSLRFMCRFADSISVRDPQSKQLLESIGVKRPITIIGDPAFTLKPTSTSKTYNSTPTKIGVSAVPFFNSNYWPQGSESKYKAYINAMAKNLDKLAEAHDVEFTFFATKFPQDVDATKHIKNSMKYKEHVQIIDKNLMPQEILEITNLQDVVIGTRLHSLILATATATPIIAVSYHKKVNDFMHLAGLGEYCFSMDSIEHSELMFKDSFSKMKKDWDGTVENTKKLSTHFNEEARKGASQFTKAVR
ncbi:MULTISPECIES: polysaccharide pyruvyl transferase family protein [Psychrobacillus]|uniref:polysaccharide pyruvyl transferase family protein n=1 Tax=Psychrobacillus TaxID=1221880 RepID=UPI0030F50FF3